jgi:hypothetical protein
VFNLFFFSVALKTNRSSFGDNLIVAGNVPKSSKSPIPENKVHNYFQLPKTMWDNYIMDLSRRHHLLTFSPKLIYEWENI